MTDILPILIRMLEDEVAAKRTASAIVLAELAPKDEDVLVALRGAAAHPDDAVLRRWVVEAIGAIGPETIVQDLQPLVRDRDRRVRNAVKQVLSTSDAVSEDDIGRMLDGSDERERLAAVAVLGAMGTEQGRTRLIGKLRGANAKMTSAVIDAIRPHLVDADDETTKKVIRDLSDQLDADAVASDPDFALAAVQILGNTGHDDAADALMRVAAVARDDAVRESALETVQKLVRGRAPKVFEKLLDIVDDKGASAVVRAACLNALVNLEVPVQMEPRVRTLTSAESPQERKWAITALGTMDTAPAAEALANAVVDGTPDDRALALASAAKTGRGLAALARLLGRLEDEERASQVARVLRSNATAIAPSTKHALEQAVMEAPPKIGRLILDVLKHTGDGGARATEGSLLDRAVVLRNKAKYADAIALLRSLSSGSDADPEARYHLGVCELKTSKKKIGRGPNNDACILTFSELLKSRDFPLVDRLTNDKIVDADDLFYVGFSFAERADSEKGFGGDILVHLSEADGDEKISGRAHNKLKTMGWLE